MQTVYLAPKEIHLEPIPCERLGGWMEWLEGVVNREKRGSLAQHGLDNDTTEREERETEKGEIWGAKMNEEFRVQKIFTLRMTNERDRLHGKSQTRVETLGLRGLASALQHNNWSLVNLSSLTWRQWNGMETHLMLSTNYSDTKYLQRTLTPVIIINNHIH